MILMHPWLLGEQPDIKILTYHVEPHKSIQDIAKALTSSVIPVKVIQEDEENRKLIFSEKETSWSRYSSQLKVGDLYEGIVGSIEDYGVFVLLRFPDGQYHLTGLVHVSEVSWDLVQDVRDVLTEGDKVNAKIVNIDREKSQITMSIKQLEEDPLLETLDKIIPRDASVDSDTLSANDHLNIEPLPGLDTIIGELLKEDGIDDVRISRQGFEKRVVSQDLQLWLSNVGVNKLRSPILVPSVKVHFSLPMSKTNYLVTSNLAIWRHPLSEINTHFLVELDDRHAPLSGPALLIFSVI